MAQIRARKVKFAVSVYVYKNDTEMTTETFLFSEGREGRPNYDLWYDTVSGLFIIELKDSTAPVVYTSMSNVAYYEVEQSEHKKYIDGQKKSPANSEGVREEKRRSGRHSRS